jgi:hypothetical protein
MGHRCKQPTVLTPYVRSPDLSRDSTVIPGEIPKVARVSNLSFGSAGIPIAA